jgi:hypothetical protein
METISIKSITTQSGKKRKKLPRRKYRKQWRDQFSLKARR